MTQADNTKESLASQMPTETSVPEQVPEKALKKPKGVKPGALKFRSQWLTAKQELVNANSLVQFLGGLHTFFDEPRFRMAVAKSVDGKGDPIEIVWKRVQGSRISELVFPMAKTAKGIPMVVAEATLGLEFGETLAKLLGGLADGMNKDRLYLHQLLWLSDPKDDRTGEYINFAFMVTDCHPQAVLTGATVLVVRPIELVDEQ
jgi:hypothetical protein